MSAEPRAEPSPFTTAVEKKKYKEEWLGMTTSEEDDKKQAAKSVKLAQIAADSAAKSTKEAAESANSSSQGNDADAKRRDARGSYTRADDKGRPTHNFQTPATGFMSTMLRSQSTGTCV